jgi:AcrR family transcriptional regulator
MTASAVATAARGRRLAGEERRRRIVEAAAHTFAETGFSTSTRALADRMEVTQALLYRYFPSKEALVEAVFEAWFLDPGVRADPALLDDPSWSLADRLGNFYAAFLAAMSEVRLRLFLRAALDQLPLPARYAARLDEGALWPVLGALRGEAGLPPLADLPPQREEREVAMMLHGTVVFLGIRKYIYRIALAEPLADLIAMQARVYAPGAVREIRRIQTADPEHPPERILRTPAR